MCCLKGRMPVQSKTIKNKTSELAGPWQVVRSWGLSVRSERKRLATEARRALLSSCKCESCSVDERTWYRARREHVSGLQGSQCEFKIAPPCWKLKPMTGRPVPLAGRNAIVPVQVPVEVPS